MTLTANARLASAFAASVLFHAFVIAWMGQAQRLLPAPRTPEAIEVSIAPAAKPQETEESPVVAPARSASSASPAEAVTPRRLAAAPPRKRPPRKAATAAPPPTQPTASESVALESPPPPPPAAAERPGETMAAELSPPVAAVPAPRFAPAAPPAAGDAKALADYGRVLSRAIAREQRYPRLARENGWQGTVEVALEVAPGNRLRDVRVVRSSGFGVLDERALEMVRAVSPLPPAPDELQRRDFRVQVPITFRLQN
jgi:protein TonB